MSQQSQYKYYKQQEEQLLNLDDSPYPTYLELLKLTKINALIQLFISAQDVRQSSKNTYCRTLRQYFSWVDQKGYDLSLVARPQIIEYKINLLNSGLSSLTIASYISYVRRFYEWCESEKIYPNVAKGVKGPKRQNKFRRQGLSPEQSQNLLSYFQERSPRDYAIISLLLRSGLRTIELIRADVSPFVTQPLRQF